jgi:hypothetical protein
MLPNIFLSSNLPFQEFSLASSEDFGQPLNNLSNTLITLQYEARTLLSFRVHEASQGTIGKQEPNSILKCQIRGNNYTFSREHLDQLSDREYTELLNQLKIDKSAN